MAHDQSQLKFFPISAYFSTASILFAPIFLTLYTYSHVGPENVGPENVRPENVRPQNVGPENILCVVGLTAPRHLDHQTCGWYDTALLLDTNFNFCCQYNT